MIKKGDLKVGIFVLFGLVLAVLVIFLIGDERRVFNSSETFYARFADVSGLARGAPVQMGGVRIGQVKAVNYSEDPDDPKVHVELDIVASEAVRIRSDSTVSVIPKGLLGDKQLSVKLGVKGDALAPGSEIPSFEGGDMFSRLDTMAEKADKTFDDLAIIAERLANEELHDDIQATAKGMSVLMQQVTEGDGYPARFLRDKHEAERISRAIDNLGRTADELTLTLREVRATAARVRTGPGFAHDVIYGAGPQKEIAQVGMAAEEFGLTLRGIREGNGFAHDVLFGGDSDTRDAISNVTEMTADLRDIVRNVKQGKGTIGALLVDPSIYEDVKRLLGNVERNSVLRALVRYSIKKNDPPPRLDVGKANERRD
jgi:phospholipid/cholesterol/gamma-HCH transport system substrate-binding protein